MSNQTGRSIRAQLMWLSLIIVTVSVAFPCRHLYITLRTERKTWTRICLTPHPFSPRCPS